MTDYSFIPNKIGTRINTDLTDKNRFLYKKSVFIRQIGVNPCPIFPLV